MDYSPIKIQSRVLIDKESVRTTHRQKNNGELLSNMESEWTAHRKRIRVNDSATENKLELLIEKETVRKSQTQRIS